MHYDLIIYKFIPSRFILINNKSYNGYKNVFSDILDYIKIYKKEVNTNLNWRYFTTDFEPALIKAFKDTFNDTCISLQHQGCYFHFLKNIRKKLISKGYNSLEKKEKLDEIMKFCSELPFEKNIDKKYSTIIEKQFSKNKELSF